MTSKETAIFVFTPSHQQQQYLEHVLDSIVENLSIDCEFALFTDKVNKDFSSKHNINIREISDRDHDLLRSIYFKEGRADIPAFSAYAQFLIPDYFPEYEHFIYLEVDQIVKGDMAPLWKFCLDSKMKLGAAPFLDDDYKRTTVDSFYMLNGSARCYNTGVLFVNSEYWLKNNCRSRCIEECKLQALSGGKRLQYYAQGAINNALHMDISEIHRKYNSPGFGSVRGIRKHIIDSAVLLHWTGRRKPWSGDGLYKDLYFKGYATKLDDYHVRFHWISLARIKLKRKFRDARRLIKKYLRSDEN